MRLTRFAALSFLLACGSVVMPLERATAQPVPSPAAEPGPPPPAEAAPPPPTPAEAAPPPTQAAPPPPPTQAGPPPPATQAGPPPSGAVTHSNVNLRNGPGTSYAIVTLIPAGSPVEVNDCKNEWCHVAFHGQDGYIIESSIAPGAPRAAVRRPPPGYAGPPPGYDGPPPGYYGPAPGYYYPPPAYGYYGPYWRGRYWRRW